VYSSCSQGVEDALIEIEDTPEHDELCKRQAERLLEAITQNVDLSGHLSDAVESLRIVLAADESIRTGRTVELV
jgi:predicted dehydrogenase